MAETVRTVFKGKDPREAADTAQSVPGCRQGAFPDRQRTKERRVSLVASTRKCGEARGGLCCPAWAAPCAAR